MMPRILVVDDEHDVQQVVSDVLSEVGYDVVTVESSQAALAAIEEQPYDLVISDLRLPDAPGTVLAEQLLLRRPELLDRVILLTGDFADLTGYPTIRKPFSLDHILRVVEERLARV